MDYNKDFAISVDDKEDLRKRLEALQKFSDSILENTRAEKKIIKRPAYIFPHRK